MDEKFEKEDYRDGFEAGVIYAFRQLALEKISETELSRFVERLESKCPWKTYSEWYEAITGHCIRMVR